MLQFVDFRLLLQKTYFEQYKLYLPMTSLPEPQGRQRDVVFLKSTGHQVVLGSAGSGKTTMALHRAIYLQQKHTEEGEKTLLITFNKMLVKYMKSFETQLPIGLVVENYHKTARGYLNVIGKMTTGCILDNKTENVKCALDTVRSIDKSSFLEKPLSLFIEEIKWIQQFGIQSLPEYVKIERVGRSGKGTRIERSNRPLVWTVYQTYLQIRQNQGYLYDWDDLGIHLHSELSIDKSRWIYRHIIIDEGQDFSPAMIRSLSSAVPSNGSLTLFGDVAQQIYGVRVSWKNAGLKIDQPWKFKENYRNTKEIASLALSLSKTQYFRDEPDLVTPTAPRADGPKPTILRTPSSKRELAVVCHYAKEFSRTHTVAILLQNRGANMRSYISHLKQQKCQVFELHPEKSHWTNSPCVFVGTYQAAKGLEFSTVFLPLCDKNWWPNSKRIDEVGYEEASLEDARLLYVGITRAKKQLVISHSSEITSLLPNDENLYLSRTVAS